MNKKSDFPYKKVKSPMWDFWEKASGNIDKKYFSSRMAFNRDLWKLLEADKEFSDDVSSIRNDFTIPKLEMVEDMQFVPLPEPGETKSSWIENSPKESKSRFYKEVKNLLIKYHLPFYCNDFLIDHILYGTPLSRATTASAEYAVRVLTSQPDELERLAPTSQEKRMLKEFFRQTLNIKRRPNTKNAKIYKDFLTTLNSYKNKTRRLRTLDTALKTSKAGKKVRQINQETQEIKVRKTTFLDLIPSIFTFDEEATIGPKKLSARLRQQKKRLKERAEKMKN